MAIEILKAVVYCHRVIDNKDFTEKVICIPPGRAKDLEQELINLRNEGVLDIIQLGRVYIQATAFTTYEDEVDKFLNKIRPHSSTDRAPFSENEDDGTMPSEAPNFTGFEDVLESDTQMSL